NLNASTRWTNTFAYDGGVAAGLGVLTRDAAPGSVNWSGVTDGFSRVGTETNSVSHRAAYGRLNGPATTSISLDGQPMPAEVLTTSDHLWSSQWRATLELTPGVHQLSASALHPSGLFTTNVSVWFTNNAASETTSDSFDGA